MRIHQAGSTTCLAWYLAGIMALGPVLCGAETVQQLAVPTGLTENKAPAWTTGGAFVYRIATPDNPDVLPALTEGLSITSHLLDGSVGQIPLIMGLIGHDHTGPWNWDGLWPYWGRVTFRAGDWDRLSAFMKDVHEKSGVKVSFHLNLTDVNVGLRDYPESQQYFARLVATKSLYRRENDPKTNRRDGDPFVPWAIPADEKDPAGIYAIVNYKNYWDSGLAKEMIDSFYRRLPYAPPILYLDVLTATGGNLNVGFPDGPLGGSKETQIAGMNDIAAYLHGKGTDLATEGDRPQLGRWATYVWLHGSGVSANDYSVISGGSGQLPWQQVLGDAGAFNLSPIASTPGGLASVRAHYANLLASRPDSKKMAARERWHVSDRSGMTDEFDIPGTGDPFRGDWSDLVNNFYLMSIQELYFIGKHTVRTALYNRNGRFHLAKVVLTGPRGTEIPIPIADFLSSDMPDWIRKGAARYNSLMMETPEPGNAILAAHCAAPLAGKYKVRLIGGGATGAMNIYANGKLQLQLCDIMVKSQGDMGQPFDVGEIDLNAGGNVISLDTGPLYAKWSDGTESLWSTPGIYKNFTVKNGDVIFADDYDRMWPDSWSGQNKIYFFSWDGTARTWKLPQDWASIQQATVFPLTPDGRGAGIHVAITDRSISLRLLPQVPYVLVP